MQENNGGYSGSETWLLADSYLAPTESQPIIVATLNYLSFPGVGTLASLSEEIPANPVATRREWNMLRESAMYYSETFPTSNP